MAHLRDSDLRGVTEALQDVYACLDLDAFPDRVLSMIQRLIPADHVSYNEVHPRTFRSRTIVRPEGADRFPGDDAAFARHLSEHPFLSHLPRMADGRPRTISDFLSRARFHRLGIYNEYYRRLGIEYQIAVALCTPPELAVGLAFSRHARDFSERERLLLDLLAPHLRQAYGHAVEMTRLRRRLARIEDALDADDQAIVVLSRHGTVRVETDRGRRWLAEYFGQPHGAVSSLPDELRRWIDHQKTRGLEAELRAARRPLVRERDGRRLEVRLTGDRGERVLLLRERRMMIRLDAAESLGLSRREAQVLTFVATGKRNHEIARILGSRPRTVGKHLERIYAKLGVDTRTAATARVLALSDTADASTSDVSRSRTFLADLFDPPTQGKA
jgi:DNA-binding CsgD family transcriptional regulator